MSASTLADATLTRESQRFVGPFPFHRNGLNPYLAVQGFPLTMLNNTSSDFELTIRQQPARARVAGGKEKGRLQLSQALHPALLFLLLLLEKRR